MTTDAIDAVAPVSGRPLRLGTRASELATSQSGWVADRLRARGHEVELVLVQTDGDRSSAPLTQIGGTGVFVSALREALLEGRIDCAVHSLKDIPVAEEPGLVVVAVPEREDPRDVLVARDGLRLADLPEGARIGTGSPRRAVQLRAAAPATQVSDLRGNVGSRVAKVTSGALDAIVLAAAGLNRLGRADEASEVLDTAVMLPAPGQGALAVECRADDVATRDLLAVLEHAPTRTCVTAERVLLAELEAGCSAPVGALARIEGDEIVLDAVVGDAAGHIIRHRLRGAEATRLGCDMAHHFLSRLGPAGLHDPSPAPAAQHPGA